AGQRVVGRENLVTPRFKEAVRRKRPRPPAWAFANQAKPPPRNCPPVIRAVQRRRVAEDGEAEVGGGGSGGAVDRAAADQSAPRRWQPSVSVRSGEPSQRS